MVLLVGNAHAEDRCELRSHYDVLNGTGAPHLVSFVFTGVEKDEVALAVDDVTLLQRELETRDWSTEFSGETRCLLVGRYGLDVRIGPARGKLYLDITDRMTIYLSQKDGVVTFNVWGPDAPGLD